MRRVGVRGGEVETETARARKEGEEEACTCGRATAFVGKEGPTSALQLAAQRTRTCFDDAIGQPQISLDLHEQ